MIEPCWTVPELRKRGWTDRLIRKLLGEPDEIKRSLHFWKAPPTQLYACTKSSQPKAIRPLSLINQAGRSAQQPARRLLSASGSSVGHHDHAVLPVLSRLCAHASASRGRWIGSRPIRHFGRVSIRAHQRRPARLCARFAFELSQRRS